MAFHQIPWPSSMISKSARSLSVAPFSQSNHSTGTASCRPSRRSTRSHSWSTSTAAADGNLSRWFFEELIPGPQKEFAVRYDDPPDSLDLTRIVPMVGAQTHRREPEDRSSLPRLDMDVRSLVSRSVLVRVEEEPVGPEPVDRRHTYLVDSLDGNASVTRDVYPGLTR